MREWRNGLLIMAAACLVGCSSPNQPWAAWQRYKAKSQRFRATEAYPEFVTQSQDRVTSQLVLHFGFDDSQLTKEDRAHLDDLVASFQAKDNATIRLEGYTDERGSREYNVALGWRRAKAVSDYLIQKGVDPRRLDLVSYGPEKPVATAHNEEAWHLNRRVELSIGEYR